MAFPPPPALTKEEFRRRREKLIAAGKPITLSNIDPELAEWQARVHISRSKWAGIAIAAILLAIVMLMTAIAR